MPAQRTPMRKIREILRLKWTTQLSNREIAKSCSTARSTVAGCLERASNAALSWPLPESLDDTALEQLLYTSLKSILVNGLDSKPLPAQILAKPFIIHPNIRGNDYYN